MLLYPIAVLVAFSFFPSAESIVQKASSWGLHNGPGRPSTTPCQWPSGWCRAEGPRSDGVSPIAVHCWLFSMYTACSSGGDGDIGLRDGKRRRMMATNPASGDMACTLRCFYWRNTRHLNAKIIDFCCRHCGVFSATCNQHPIYDYATSVQTPC